jgi:hypothetical protein
VSKLIGFLRRFGTWIVVAIAVPLLIFVIQDRFLARDSPAPTTVTLIRPFDLEDTLSARLRPVHRVVGQCLASGFSEGTSNPDAHRCFGDDGVYDPCWTTIGGRVAACPEVPWGPKTVLLDLRRPARLRRNPPALDLDEPWGTRLGNGERCLRIQGAGVPTVAGQRVNYSCPHGHAVGFLDRKPKPWTIPYAATGEAGTRPVAVVHAWY